MSNALAVLTRPFDRIPEARRKQIGLAVLIAFAVSFPLWHDNDADIDSMANAAAYATLALQRFRFAPALSIIRLLLAEGALVQAYDPKAMEKARKEMPEVTYCRDVYEAATGADAVVLLTEWDEFRRVDWKRLGTLVERSLTIDGRNALSRKEVISHGFQYVGIGGVSGVPETAPSIAHI